MSIEFHIARRYLTQKKETGFITLIMYLSMAGLTIGVAALILTLGILNGFENSIKEIIINFQAHIRVETFDKQGFSNGEATGKKIAEYPEVRAVSPFVEKESMLLAGEQADGVIVRGIDPEKINNVINVAPLIRKGKLDLGPNAGETSGILIGSDLAERFDLGIGDLVVLSSPPGMTAGLLGRPSIRQYQLRGIFETGMSEFDNLYAFIGIGEAQSFFKMPGKISGFDIRLHDISQSAVFSRKLGADLGYPFFPQTWLDINETLFDWMNVQRLPILIAFGMIILVGSINLINSQILIVFEKQKDIGILKSMGARSKTVLLIFLIIGIIIGLTATAAGSLLALLLGWVQNTYHIFSLNKEVYYIHSLPVELDWKAFLRIGLIANALCLAAVLYPAWKASQLLPAESMRRI